MKVLSVILILLAVPWTAYAHDEIFFPKLFSPAELPTTGFVFLNPDSFTATVNVVLLSAGGSTVSSTTMQVGPQSQVARLGTELFQNPAAGGWVYALTDSEGMQALWLNYDAGITFLDGAEAARYETIGADQIVPLVAGDAELNIVNPNFFKVGVTIRLFGNEGELGPVFSAELAVAGGFQAQASAIFPLADMAQARYIRIRSTGAAIASSALIRSFLVPSESAVVSGENAGSRTELNFPHVISGSLGGASYATVIGLTNLSGSAQSVTITFNPEQGNSMSVTRVLPGSGALRETVQSLFGLTGQFRGGWVRVNGQGPLTGVAAYADVVGGALAVVPAAIAQTHLFFSHIANGPPQWQTGIALLNTGSVPASVEVYAMNSSGSLIGKAGPFTLEPGRKIANAIHELIAQADNINGGFIYVKTLNSVPLLGIELFYTEDLKVLSNVAAGKLAPGIVYTPPAP
jgi:hypothetical protein